MAVQILTDLFDRRESIHVFKSKKSVGISTFIPHFSFLIPHYTQSSIRVWPLSGVAAGLGMRMPMWS